MHLHLYVNTNTHKGFIASFTKLESKKMWPISLGPDLELIEKCMYTVGKVRN